MNMRDAVRGWRVADSIDDIILESEEMFSIPSLTPTPKHDGTLLLVNKGYIIYSDNIFLS